MEALPAPSADFYPLPGFIPRTKRFFPPGFFLSRMMRRRWGSASLPGWDRKNLGGRHRSASALESNSGSAVSDWKLGEMVKRSPVGFSWRHWHSRAAALRSRKVYPMALAGLIQRSASPQPQRFAISRTVRNHRVAKKCSKPMASKRFGLRRRALRSPRPGASEALPPG